MFKFEARRELGDMFINIHNKELTILLGCNTNIQIGMSGKSIFYVTGYQAKQQQKDETQAYETVSKVIIKVLERQSEEDF